MKWLIRLRIKWTAARIEELQCELDEAVREAHRLRGQLHALEYEVRVRSAWV